MDIKKEREKLGQIYQQALGIRSAAEKENRDMTPEEETRFDAAMDDFDKLKEKVEAEERRLERMKAADEWASRSEQEPPRNEPSAPANRDNPRAGDEYREAFARFLRSGYNVLSHEEYRAMQADNDIGGGYLVTPQQFIMELLKDVDAAVVIRQLARTFQLTQAESLGVPTLDKDADEAEWTSELKTGGTTELEFGKRELRPHPLAKRALISNKLMRASSISIEQLVRERLAYKFGVTEEKAFLLGDGNEKPLGIFVASSLGISTKRDVNTGNATGFTGDGLIDARYALKDAYVSNARWLFHRDAVKAIRKIKNQVDGQYIWQPGITGGAPDRILEIPYVVSEFAPNTYTNGNYAGILGDFRYYWIADALDMQIQRLVELYAESNQTGFIGRLEVDGMPVKEEAFVRMKCAV